MAKKRGRPPKKNLDQEIQEALGGKTVEETPQECPGCEAGLSTFTTPANRIYHDGDPPTACKGTCSWCDIGVPTFIAPSGKVYHEGADIHPCKRPEHPLITGPAGDRGPDPQLEVLESGGAARPNETGTKHPGSVVSNPQAPPLVTAPGVNPPRGDERMTR